MSILPYCPLKHSLEPPSFGSIGKKILPFHLGLGVHRGLLGTGFSVLTAPQRHPLDVNNLSSPWVLTSFKPDIIGRKANDAAPNPPENYMSLKKRFSSKDWNGWRVGSCIFLAVLTLFFWALSTPWRKAVLWFSLRKWPWMENNHLKLMLDIGMFQKSVWIRWNVSYLVSAQTYVLQYILF